MEISRFISLFNGIGVGIFTGVPDSQLKPLCNYLINTYGISKNHIIAANEGNCTAIAAGYHLATGGIPVIYLQNSGIGNIINPVASLLNDKVYGIPCIFIIGWRGEPGAKDEPQHIYQGQVTLNLLGVMDIAAMVIDNKTDEEEVEAKMKEFKPLLDAGKSVAFVVRKGALTYDEKVVYKNDNKMLREEIIRHITAVSREDIIVSTTGKTSRELFEIREEMEQSHKYDFLTVGSMGHSSSIALGIALNKPKTRIWCLDGDGAALMHMGSMAVIGAKSPTNFIHVIINNAAHESVGGQPTVANKINFGQIALGCGYKDSFHASNIDELDAILSETEEKQGPILIEVVAAIGSRDNLGRPTTTPIENKIAFMEYLRECD
jgi:phosphonopyruvate decarboxylase